MITVFTPTYNRAHLLPRLYESLCRQTFTDFEWVIVDDGSVDDTKSLVNKFLVDKTQHSTLNTNTIRYFYQENGGKHRAINRGVKEAQGELFLILDSDDTLPEKSLETINHYYQQIKDDRSFGGVCGYMAHHDGTIIGRGCDMPLLDANSIDWEYKYGGRGDMCEVFRTEVLREIPFPDIPGERFVPENLVLFRIAHKYKLRIFKKVVYYRDYLEGGLTDKIIKIRMKSPIAATTYYAELNSCNIPYIHRMKAAINYYRFHLCLSNSSEDVKQIKWYWMWTKPLGWLMHVNDKRITK